MKGNKIKIEYAPDTVFIIGPKENSFMVILNSKGLSMALQDSANNIENHCQKCKEKKLAILN